MTDLSTDILVPETAQKVEQKQGRKLTCYLSHMAGIRTKCQKYGKFLVLCELCNITCSMHIYPANFK